MLRYWRTRQWVVLQPPTLSVFSVQSCRYPDIATSRAIIGRTPTPPLAEADIPAQCEAMSKPKKYLGNNRPRISTKRLPDNAGQTFSSLMLRSRWSF